MAKFLLLTLICFATALNAAPIRVVVWDERAADAMQVYTNSIGNHIAEYLKTLPGLSVKSVGLSDPDMGLADETLTNCDVLI